MSDAYFERIDASHFCPTDHMGGGWDPTELHFSPIGGLLVHAIEEHLVDRGERLLLSRISFDILGRLANDVCEVHVESIRPGRTIELVEATLTIAGRAAVTARAWLLAPSDTSTIEGGGDQPLAAPETVADLPIDLVDGLDTFEELPPDGRRVGHMWV